MADGPESGGSDTVVDAPRVLAIDGGLDSRVLHTEATVSRLLSRMPGFLEYVGRSVGVCPLNDVTFEIAHSSRSIQPNERLGVSYSARPTIRNRRRPDTTRRSRRRRRDRRVSRAGH